MKVKLEVTLEDGQLTMSDGRALPRIPGKVSATLLVEEADIQDKYYETARRDEVEILLDVSEGIAIRLASAKFDPPSHKALPSLNLPFSFARIVLEGPLRIRRRVGQNDVLPKQPVFLPDLNLKVESLNQACTKLSERFEPDRQTHTYSAFEVVYIRRAGVWEQLKTLL